MAKNGTEIKFFEARRTKENNTLVIPFSIKTSMFWITGMRLVQGKNGWFLGMPDRNIEGERKDIVWPVSAEARDKLTKWVVEKYKEKYPNSKAIRETEIAQSSEAEKEEKSHTTEAPF